MSVFIKICGLTSAEAVEETVAAGADAVGFVFAKSPRQVTIDQACEIAAAIPAHVVRVAVMKHPTQAEVDAVVQGFKPDWLQTDAEDLAALDMGQRVQPLPVFRDTPALDEGTVARAARALFEASESGAGQQVDWQRASRLAGMTSMMLAGGLDADNVAAAIKQVAPWGVDVSSGVESSRGIKDINKIQAFIRSVRETEAQDAS
ncbi:MAG: phosphoribosylanthranilate isomerase [Gammaproteobacteria bacterium]|nr:phosphoribosylanthranilate isomerase [Gammaproteobacteria bacterium]